MDDVASGERPYAGLDGAHRTYGGGNAPPVSAELQPGYYAVAPDRVLKLNLDRDGYDMPEQYPEK